MNRFKKYLATAVLLVLPILAACGDGPLPPPATGSIAGQVSIEGTGADGVSVNLSNGASTTTAGGGNYRFDGVQAGSYTVTISGFPADASFDATSASVTIPENGGSVTQNFQGSYIRTASVMGTVTVEGAGLSGVTVRLSGMADAQTATDMSGQYAFTGLRAGTYAVEISGFDGDEVAFGATSSGATVGVGESKIVSFDGTYLRTAGITGRVTVEGTGLQGVTVSLSGVEQRTMTTDAGGQYAFSKLKAGDYSVAISGYETDDYEFGQTQMNVTLATGETATVPFDGTLLRTAGISGRVSVEGIGLADVTVTLSGADMDDRTAMTDAGGTYAFSGLAAGDYTVSIAIEGDAYVFESMSMEVTVADDQTAIVNFEGTHATTASISGMLFVDEAAKNDSYDEGEDPFPAAGIPVVLVGPGVNDRMPSATNEMGQFMFANLKAGAYQLVVAITPAVQVALGDFAYGGPSTGYAFDIAVGEQATQAIPFHITHQTVNFSVWLKHGDATGDALPGATVKLYADQAGSSQVGTGMTAGEMALTSIRFPRAGTSGNTVFAGIEAEGYDVSGGMQAVMWDPKYPTGDVVTNTADVVNLTADVSFSGATITTAAGGGDPLAGWTINVTMMDDDGEMVAVEGAAEMLGEEDAADEGMAAFMSTAASADDLPMTYYFAIEHDSIQDDDFDGGEMFDVMPMPSDYAMADGSMLVYEHDGLSVAGKMDLGTLEVKYTTQTLVVWVHQEKDQVAGYTRTVSGGDSRPRDRIETASGHPQRWKDTGIFFELRHIDANGRSRPVSDYENRTRHPGYSSSSSRDGRAVYSNVPADLNIVVKASTDVDRKIISVDEAQAWRDFEANKVMGGAFGEHGGISHTVNLCPETADDPDQDFLTSCSTFGYVWTRDISGDAYSTDVVMGEDPTVANPFVANTDYHSGIAVSLNSVDLRNVQADNFGSTTAAENRNTSARELGTYGIANVGDGDYSLSVSGGFWDVSSGYKRYTHDERSLTSVAPVGAPAAQTIDLVPTTVDIYGVIRSGGAGFEVADVEVTAAGQTVITDYYGRYILEDVSVLALSRAEIRITVAKTGYAVQSVVNDTDPPAARTKHARDNGYSFRYRDAYGHEPRRLDFNLSERTPTGTVSGTVKHLQSSDPIEGVRVFALPAGAAAAADLWKPGLVQIDKDAAGDAVYTFGGMKFAAVDTTDADGSFTVRAPAGALDGMETTILAYHSGMFFTPDKYVSPVVNGGEYAVDFQGLRLSAITGRVVDGAGDGMDDVTVTATGGTTGAGGVSEFGITNPNGRYNIRVPWGPYTVTPSKAEYTFTNPTQSVTLAAEQIRTLQDFTATHDGTVPMVSLVLTPASITEAGGVSTVTATLNRMHSADVTVTVAAAPKAGANAAEMSDFTVSTNKVLTITAGVTASTGTVTITANPDDTEADNEEVEVTGTAATTGTVTGPAAKTLTITDDDAAGGKVTLELSATEIKEGEASTVTATIGAVAPRAFVVTVSAAPMTDVKFVGGNTRLFFAAGATMSSGSAVGEPVTIMAEDRTDVREGDRTVTVSGSVTAESLMTAPDDVMLTIKDNELPAPKVTLELSRNPIQEADDASTSAVNENETVLTAHLDRTADAEVTVSVTIPSDDDAYTGGSASAQDLTIPIGSRSSALNADGTAKISDASITITAVADDEDGDDEKVEITATADDDGDGATAADLMQPDGVTLTINDDDAAPGMPTGLTASAGDAASDPVTLQWTAPNSLGSMNGEDVTAANVVYQYRSKISGQPHGDDWVELTVTTVSGKLQATVTGPTPSGSFAVGTEYKFQVRAVANDGTNDGPAGVGTSDAEATIPTT